MIFSNKVYDVLKKITQIVIPATATFYFALAGIWGFPYGEEVVGTLAALTTFLGVVLGISNSQYKKAGYDTDGALIIESGDDISGNSYIQFDKDLDVVQGKNQIVLEVLKNDE